MGGGGEGCGGRFSDDGVGVYDFRCCSCCLVRCRGYWFLLLPVVYSDSRCCPLCVPWHAVERLLRLETSMYLVLLFHLTLRWTNVGRLLLLFSFCFVVFSDRLLCSSPQSSPLSQNELGTFLFLA